MLPMVQGDLILMLSDHFGIKHGKQLCTDIENTLNKMLGMTKQFEHILRFQQTEMFYSCSHAVFIIMWLEGQCSVFMADYHIRTDKLNSRHGY